MMRSLMEGNYFVTVGEDSISLNRFRPPQEWEGEQSNTKLAWDCQMNPGK
jgi:hypothetical protein